MQQEAITYLPIGLANLDSSTGGLPRGQITLLYGESGTGKTTIALQAAANLARRGMKTVFIDADNSFYPERLAKIAEGDSEVLRLIFVFRPMTFQALTHILEDLGRFVSMGVALVVVDTMNSLYRRAMTERRNVFQLNRELNLQLAYLVEAARTHGIAILVTSQVRSFPRAATLEPKIVPVGSRVIEFWPQRILRISFFADKSLREVCVERAEAAKFAGVKTTLKLGMEGFADR